jgi:hypothetical protein
LGRSAARASDPISRPNYLIAKGSGPDDAQAAADAMSVPLLVTKRGALAFARKR